MTGGDGAQAGEPILPGATIGVLGGGQLGRMLGQAARRIGYGFVVYDPDPGCPAAAVADEQVVAAYDDEPALERFARRVDVVTFEFENVPAGPLAGLAKWVPVRPAPAVLETCRDRVAEKTFLQGCGVPIAPWRACVTLAEAEAAAGELGKGVLKTAQFGYDGKGQRTFASSAEAGEAFIELGEVSSVAEGWVDFDREVSTLVARAPGGEMVVYPVVENRHVDHILDTTLAPAPGASDELRASAAEIARTVAEHFDLVGLLAVEMFVVGEAEGSPRLMVNELAPRPHNSGHYTIEACVTDQFEQQLRAICGLPLGDTSMRVPAAAMVNLLGDLWRPLLVHPTVPPWVAALDEPTAKLHLYGKRQARVGRKMGHITATAEDTGAAAAAAERARAGLLGQPE
ncbi:MAG: 5-(carboxyamino)imidazole ribonucleotide synthase [Planctomycetota bacterium]